jgi:peptide/nickel transport system substrate-binding protein
VLVGEERFPGRQGRLLFAYLVAEQGRPVPRDELAEALWGEAPPATWEKALTVLVSKLRSLLVECGLDGAIALTSAFGSYRLTLPEGAWVDVIAAADAVAESEAALAADDLEQAKAVATEGASLARPLFLSGEEGDWVDAKRRELADILRRALSCLAEACLRAGEQVEAAKWATETIALEPFRETGYRHLMAAHAAAGNRAEALRVYERCRQLLATELGAYPSPETESIYRELLEAPAHEPPAVAPEAALLPVLEREPLPTEAPAPTAAPRHRPRRTIVLGALAGIIAAAVAIPLFVLGGGANRVDLGDAPGNIIGVLDAGSGAAIAAAELPAPPTAVAAGLGLVWAASADANAVYAIDPDTNSRGDTIEVGNAPGGIAVGGGYVWVTNSLDRTVWRITPQGQVLNKIPVGNGPTGVAVGGGHVWVANTTDHTVSKIRASDGKLLESYSAVADPGAVAVGEGAVWVVSKSSGAVIKLNPGNGQPLKKIHVGEGPAAIAVGHGFVWVADNLSGRVFKIDPATGSIDGVIKVGAGSTGVAIVGGEVWTANELAGTISRIDPVANHATTVRLGSGPTALAAANGIVYVAVRPTGAAHRGGTLTVALSAKPPAETLDLAVGSFSELWFRSVTLTNDGLLTYRQVGGQAGNQLVPDLALSPPVVSADGKTYTFQLRPNIRYSNGRLVRARDFRYAIERGFRLGPGAFATENLFRGIRGAERCDRRRCDLAAGIVTDDAARTIMFRLSAPDPYFLYKLTFTFAAAVPAGTSLQEAKRRPLPATGPYRIASFIPNRSIRLVRNPRFREWSKAAQPAGFADEILLKAVPAQKERIALVEQGKVDLTSSSTGGDPFPVPPAFWPWLHRHPQLSTVYLVLNSNRPPFDDLGARQAVNYALDRTKVVRLAGGEDVNRPTCQVLPPNFPGYRRYCPYTLDSSADRGWTAPDVAKATRLVTASGTAGARVTLWVPRFGGIRLGHYLADLLKSLGYIVHLRSSFGGEKTDPFGPYFTAARALSKPGARASPQIVYNGWIADYPSASSFIQPLFSCRMQHNFGQFCDRVLERKIGRAVKLEPTDPAAANRLWAELDREITDKALWVPLFNVYGADLVSKRIRNYQYNPQRGALLSQLWVR